MIKYVWSFVFIVIVSAGSIAQEIPMGTWRSHFNYSDSRLLVQYSGKVYVAAQNGLFFLDLEDNSVHTLTKNDGLGDAGVTAMAVTPNGSKLILGYSSGHIDILENNQLTSISTIKKTSAYERKQINQIAFYEDLAYIATGFGLIALDYNDGEVLESYGNIAENGGNLEAFEAAVFMDSIFLTTPEGLISTSLYASNNLLDFNNWRRYKNNVLYPEGKVKAIETFGDNLYLGFETDGLYRYDGIDWEKLDLLSLSNFQSIKVEQSLLYIIVKNQDNNQIFSLDAQNQLNPLPPGNTIMSSDLIVVENGEIWVADQALGLVADIKGRGESVFPKGPQSDNIDLLTYFNEKILATAKGIDTNFDQLNAPAYLSLFESGSWTNYTKTNLAGLAGVAGITDAAFDPITNEVFISTFGQGIMKFMADDLLTLKLVTENGTSPFSSGRMTAVSAGDNGSLWTSEYSSPDNAYGLLNNTWTRFPLGSENHVLEILSIPFQNVWLRLTNGIMVLNPETGADTLLTTADKLLVNSTVTAMDYDDNGFLWYGTASGIAYITNPGEVLEARPITIIPFYQNDDLLKNQRIDAIAVDPANRKWIATAEGLFLFGEDGDSLLHHFTAENSPLPSNLIQDIEINFISGEVYVATSKGLISYRSNASEGKATHDQVKIFPNPVRHGYAGTIGILGLVSGANVKITDLAGNLVKEVKAEGGTATWDGNTLSGGRAATGIYLIFSSSSDGKETFIGKLAFIN